MTSINDIKRPIESAFNTFDKAFAKSLTSDSPILNEVLGYILSKRGKQLRPMLVLMAAKMCKGVTDKTISTAVALELLHTASLIHDDVVDNSPMRRGSESIQARWSNKVAVLVGDFILARVIQTIAEIKNIKILSIVSQLGATLSSGELLQLHSNGSMWISEEQYYRVIEQKTAQLFAACTEAGGESSGATMHQATALRDFGIHLGMCFQLKDDVFDYSDTDSEELGKPTMSDIKDGKATLPLLISLARAPKEESEHIKKLAEDLAHNEKYLNPDEAEQELKSFVLRYEGVRYAYQKMQMHKEKAIEALKPFHDSEVKQSLINLLEYAINRIH